MGLFNTQYVPARPYLQLARRRNAATLLPIIQRRVQLGTTLHTDEWAAYRQLQGRLGLLHRAVNHSLHFVDPATGVHMQHAESNWCAAKEKFKHMKGNTNPSTFKNSCGEGGMGILTQMDASTDYYRTLLNNIHFNKAKRLDIFYQKAVRDLYV